MSAVLLTTQELALKELRDQAALAFAVLEHAGKTVWPSHPKLAAELLFRAEQMGLTLKDLR